MELCKITKTEPRKFWSAVRPKRKTKCVVDNKTISKYFENVLGADPPELSEEVLNLINNDHFENVDVDALDSEITEGFY
jgi:DNA-binding protein Fis